MQAMATTVLAVAMATLAVVTRPVHGFPGGWGPCPQPPVQEDFVVELYQGTWYEFERFPVPYEWFVVCGQATYRQLDSYSLSVNNSGIREVQIGGHTIFRERSGVIGRATIPDPEQPAKLVVSFGGQIISFFAKGNYWILRTDYETYSLVYSCTELAFGAAHYDAAWIMTRNRGVQPENLDSLKQLLRDNGVDPGNFQDADQSNCNLS